MDEYFVEFSRDGMYGGGTFGDMDTSSDAGTLSYHADNFLINMFHFFNLIL